MFPGYIGVWEQKEMQDICHYSKTHSEGNRFIGVEDLHQEFAGVNFDENRRGNGITYQQGDTLMSNIRPYLKKTWLADCDGVCSSDVLVFSPDTVAPDYLHRIISSEHFVSSVMSAAKGSKMPRGDKYQMMKMKVMIPSLSEQKQIGSFFHHLDDLLALHQRQTQKLTELKQGLLQNMFPREGESVPRLRFPGFTTTWKQHKVQDIYKITRGYVLAAPETNKNPSDDMPYPVYSSQTKNNGLMGYYKDYLYEDAITWTTDGANAGTVNYRAGKFYCTNVCGVLLSEEGYANKCAAEALNNVAWRWVSHVGNPKLMNNVMGEIPISLPVSIEEQNQISRFLEEIDNLIGLYERYVTTLIHLKKGLLQKMFPQD